MRRCAVLIVLLFWAPLFGGTLDQYATWDSRLSTSPVLQTYSVVEGYAAQARLWDSKFKAAYGPRWEILIDLRGGRPEYVYGQGVAFIPGLGNALPFDHETTVDEVAADAYSFVKNNASLFGVNAGELQLDRTAQVDEFWYLAYKRVFQGVEVKGAKLSLTVSHGNLVAFGFLNYGDIGTSTKPTLTSAQAQEALFRAVGGRLAGDVLLEPGALYLYPIMANGSTAATYTGGLGRGYEHLLVWQIGFSREGEGNWTALVDAHTGGLITLFNNAASADSDGKVTGGVYKYKQPGDDKSFSADAGLPYADVRDFSAASDCYGTTGSYCHNSSYGSILDNPPVVCSTNSSGLFHYSGIGSKQLGTRLVSPYISIFEKLANYHYNVIPPTCECEGGTPLITGSI